MTNNFCTACNYSGPLSYTNNGGLLTLGALGGLIGLLTITSGAVSCGFMIVVVGGVFLLIGYNDRKYFCSMCGGHSFIPTSSPKAQEFLNRANTFEYMESRIPDQGPLADATSSRRIKVPRRDPSP